MHGIAVALNESGARTKSKGLWHPLTAKRVLSNRSYTGVTYFGQTKRVGKSKVVAQPKGNWVPLPDVTPAIISLESFEESQRVMVKAREARPLNTKASYLLTGFIKCSKCGSPVGGTTLGGKYRYYHCRGVKPTITRDKICSARYINADEVEGFLWERVVKFASDPLMGMKLFLEASFEGNNVLPLLDQQIKDLRASVKKRWLKEKEFYSLLEHDAVTKEFVLDAANEVKKKRLEDERQLEGLEAQRNQVGMAVNLSVKLTDRWRRIHRSIEDADTLAEKRGWLEDLQVSVSALPGQYEAKCFIDADFEGGDKRFEILCDVRDKADRLMRERPDLFGDAVVTGEGLRVSRFDLEKGVELRDYFNAEEFSDLLQQIVVPEEGEEAVPNLDNNLVTIEQTSA